MKALKIPEGIDTPKITFDPDNNIFEISGKSSPADVRGFYNPVLDWITEYCKTPNPSNVFDIKLQYFNTASAKLLLIIFQRLEEFLNPDEVQINWYHPSDDEELEEAGEDFAEIVNIQFDIIATD